MSKVITAQDTWLVEGVVSANGDLEFAEPFHLPLAPGAKVSVTVSLIPESASRKPFPLEGTVLRYDDPFGAAVPTEDWEAMQ